MLKRWILPPASDVASLSRVKREADVTVFLAELLLKRGVADGVSAEAYLKPRLRSLSPPEQLPEIELAVARILAAMDRGERIVLYGDYDVDGITSLAISSRVLRSPFHAMPSASSICPRSMAGFSLAFCRREILFSFPAPWSREVLLWSPRCEMVWFLSRSIAPVCSTW